MDLPIVLSHRTAVLYYRAPDRVTVRGRDYDLNPTAGRARDVASRVRELLSDCGVPEYGLARLDVLCPTEHDRVGSKEFKSHVYGGPIPMKQLIHLAPGLFIIKPELCFILAATYMKDIELLELGFEFCGSYELDSTGNGSPYRKRKALTSVKKIRTAAKDCAGAHGARKAKRALARVRDGARSPMETALALMILAPHHHGGLSYLGIEMNRRVDIPENMRRSCLLEYLEADVFTPAAQAVIEYDGDVHAPLKQRTRDADRSSAFLRLGYRMHTVTAGHFSEQLPLHRALNGIAETLGIEAPSSAAFQRKQNELRKQLIKRWKREDDRKPAPASEKDGNAQGTEGVDSEPAATSVNGGAMQEAEGVGPGPDPAPQSGDAVYEAEGHGPARISEKDGRAREAETDRPAPASKDDRDKRRQSVRAPHRQ